MAGVQQLDSVVAGAILLGGAIPKEDANGESDVLVRASW